MTWKSSNERKQKSLGVGQLQRLTRVKKMKEREKSFLVTWISFIEQYSSQFNKRKKNNSEQQEKGRHR
jgi:hypothetical protein